MEQNIFIAKIDEKKEVVGFYKRGIHSDELCDNILENGGVLINEDLWQSLLNWTQTRVRDGIKPLIEKEVLTLEDLDRFEKIEPVIPQQLFSEKVDVKELKDRIESLEKTIKNLTDKL